MKVNEIAFPILHFSITSFFSHRRSETQANCSCETTARSASLSRPTRRAKSVNPLKSEIYLKIFQDSVHTLTF